MKEEMRKRIEQRAEEILNEDPTERYERWRRRGAELIARHEIRLEQKQTGRRARQSSLPSARDVELRRALAERLAYRELQEEGKPSWKEALDADTRRRVEERADEILRESGRS
jgi:tRNA nucleotidyltransferase (CCA-adding enzyme)